MIGKTFRLPLMIIKRANISLNLTPHSLIKGKQDGVGEYN